MAYRISDSCIACGTCIDECPVEAISAGDIYVIDADKCIECGACAGVCPSEAISLQSDGSQHENSATKFWLRYLLYKRHWMDIEVIGQMVCTSSSFLNLFGSTLIGNCATFLLPSKFITHIITGASPFFPYSTNCEIYCYHCLNCFNWLTYCL